MATHHSLSISDPWLGSASCDVAGFIPRAHPNPEIRRALRGRADLSLSTGGFAVRLRPTARELRELASALLDLAEQLEPAPAAAVEAS